MSRKTELEADLKRVGYQLGGSHPTRQARSATFGTFASTMRQLGYGIHCASQIGGKHLQAFVAARAAQGISTRTCANGMSHLCAVLSQVGKQGLARNPAYSNAALSIAPGVRTGTKQPLSDSAIRAFKTGRRVWAAHTRTGHRVSKGESVEARRYRRAEDTGQAV